MKKKILFTCLFVASMAYAESSDLMIKKPTSDKEAKLFAEMETLLTEIESDLKDLGLDEEDAPKTEKATLNLKKGLPYAKARAMVLKAGYTLRENSNPPQFGQSKELYDKGYKEIDECASSMFMPCNFYFNDKNGKPFTITTYTEESENNAIYVDSWGS